MLFLLLSVVGFLVKVNSLSCPDGQFSSFYYDISESEECPSGQEITTKEDCLMAINTFENKRYVHHFVNEIFDDGARIYGSWGRERLGGAVSLSQDGNTMAYALFPQLGQTPDPPAGLENKFPHVKVFYRQGEQWAQKGQTIVHEPAVKTQWMGTDIGHVSYSQVGRLSLIHI